MSTINYLPDQEAGDAGGYSGQQSPDAAKPEVKKEKDDPAEHEVTREVRKWNEEPGRGRLAPEQTAGGPVEQREVPAGCQ
jgi:hypothetical protein